MFDGFCGVQAFLLQELLFISVVSVLAGLASELCRVVRQGRESPSTGNGGAFI